MSINLLNGVSPEFKNFSDPSEVKTYKVADVKGEWDPYIGSTLDSIIFYLENRSDTFDLSWTVFSSRSLDVDFWRQKEVKVIDFSEEKKLLIFEDRNKNEVKIIFNKTSPGFYVATSL